MREWQAFSRRLVECLFGSVYIVGDKRRVLKPGEIDPDTAELMRLSRVWRDMLAADSWTIKLVSHVRFLGRVSLVLFAAFVVAAAIVPADSALFPAILLCFAATAPYWFWIARWRARIEQKVFFAFQQRYGKHYHLH